MIPFLDEGVERAECLLAVTSPYLEAFIELVREVAASEDPSSAA
ncbi:MAG TPA: hypothetical protein VMR89_04800 [Actinomycetota bacterium]|nr:hypothetical protein [Actinomycetota bacterium]